MAKKKEESPSLTIKFGDGLPNIYIHGFDKITPVMIDKGYDLALAEWNRLRAKKIYESRVKEQKEIENA